MTKIASLLIGLVVIAGGVLGIKIERNGIEVAKENKLVSTSTSNKANVSTQKKETPTQNKTAVDSIKSQQSTLDKNYLTDEDLLKIAGDKYADGDVPLGDYKYVTDGPKKGYVYLCNVRKDNPGSMVNGTWMHSSTWNFLEKVFVDGSVSWPNSSFIQSVSGKDRVLSGNDLPINHATGIFPVSTSDDAYKFDRNPNTISPQNIREVLPVNPVYSDVPYCMGMEVGVMLSGVNLFNGFDAGLRDAQAHELQDSCSGHPQGGGQYHYHGLSQCFKDTSVKTVLGFAYDGFPITGPKVAENKYLTTDDLDVCHGIKSEILLDGKTKVTYHYVLTLDFPYSASCFRGKPVKTGPSVQPSGAPSGSSSVINPTQNDTPPSPPQEAITACLGRSKGSICSISTPDGRVVDGTCDTPPGSSLACIPAR